MNSDNGCPVNHYDSPLHRCAAEGDIDGILTVLKGIEPKYS